jgi:hypothetical protein
LFHTTVAACLIYWIAISANMASTPGRVANTVLYSGMAAAGMLVMVLCVSSCARRRELDTLLLGLWLFGTLFFASVLNWTFNVRVLLPAVFPATLLIVRWIESEPEPRAWSKLTAWSIVPTAVVALCVAAADYEYAATVKQFVQTHVAEHLREGGKAYFTGHWGFQWYLEEAGAVALDASPIPVREGDLLVYKAGNDNFFPEAPHKLIEDIRPGSLYLHTFKYSIHANFYDGTGGGLPYGFNPDGVIEQFFIYRVVPEGM